MKKICKNCKYWDEKERDIFLELGECNSPKIIYKFPGGIHFENSKNKNMLYYYDIESYNAVLVTEPNFGCIHFEEKV